MISENNGRMGTTSIEVVSQEGPMPINLMMQEGVKALTKILSNQLQDRKTFENTEHPMQFVVKSDGDSSHYSKSGENASITSTDGDVLKMTNHLALNGAQKTGDLNSANILIDSKSAGAFFDEEFPDPELHINGEEAEIIFDYESHDMEDPTEGIGRKISEMIESVLPGGFSSDAQGRLHAIVNGNELNITEEVDDQGEIRQQEANFKNVRNSMNTNIDPRNNLDVTDVDITDDNEHEHQAGSADGYHHDRNCCPHHHPQEPSRYRNYNYHDFEYSNTNNRKQAPNFSTLIDQDKPLCMFCEYYMVFGEAPRNMIKWYNNMYGYNRMPPSRDHRHHHNHDHNHGHQEGNRKRNK
ncbi:hypothetical protein KAFR_0A07410 [Kazachstania africana CBS 2517]|uniref:Protein IBD2 n=1 Tax=Kazachstania africana (strain ATCC 22294 / BCRC 22015 / CBS 2517 / CECT 1963 / NBRC 1671 / NRRL Y-8276) TaxID=1071382 RepID=H2AP75_KAZAF|nr:hypothetical protein KAFR_0A07410 [Kazachstania africana CBS 2517]CCF56175.1 hypothetical protein KAFR_0A07410 [Kazachstania africana CBS 2517]